MWAALGQIYPMTVDLAVLEKEAGGRANLDPDELTELLRKDAHEAYDRREAEIGDEVMRELERRVMLSVLDRKWREHLYEMDYLREGIYLRAYSQRDPLVEYQREGFDMFAAMMDQIKAESVGFLFNLEVQIEEEEEGEVVEEEAVEPLRQPVPGGERREAPHIHAKGLDRPQQPQHLAYSAPSEAGDAEVRSEAAAAEDDPYAGVGRNADCPCGSGKKFKKCHGAPGGPTGLTARING
jgi:preprotein translocase subunit SecA